MGDYGCTGGGAAPVVRGGGMVTGEHMEAPANASLSELDAGVDQAINSLAEGEDPDTSQVCWESC